MPDMNIKFIETLNGFEEIFNNSVTVEMQNVSQSKGVLS